MNCSYLDLSNILSHRKVMRKHFPDDRQLLALTNRLIQTYLTQPTTLTFDDVFYLQRCFCLLSQYMSFDGLLCRPEKKVVQVLTKLYHARVKKAKRVLWEESLKVIYNPNHPVGFKCISRELERLFQSENIPENW